MEISKLLLQIDNISIKSGEKALKRKHNLIKSGLDYFKTTKTFNPDELVELL